MARHKLLVFRVPAEEKLAAKIRSLPAALDRQILLEAISRPIEGSVQVAQSDDVRQLEALWQRLTELDIEACVYEEETWSDRLSSRWERFVDLGAGWKERGKGSTAGERDPRAVDQANAYDGGLGRGMLIPLVSAGAVLLLLGLFFGISELVGSEEPAPSKGVDLEAEGQGRPPSGRSSAS
ncbi:MAG: hypothetical protein FJ125_11155, partial [Deltaproteobacteria bacterium]|nr:hypothetical protein [Deltaproteobacteria bacterium]